MEGGENLSNVTDKLNALMKERNVTAYGIAKEIGYTAPAVYSWANGEAEPKMKAIVKLSEFFNVPVTYFTD